MGSAWFNSFSDDLAERWDEYGDCQKRLRIEGPFLGRILSTQQDYPILDAAMALGCEAIFLSSLGFRVIGNEVDYRLRRRAEANARRAGASVAFTSIDWRDLENYFEPNSLGAVLILGNSLGLLANAADRRKVCDQVFRLLRPGGLFVVDSRNYDYMFECRDEILDGEFIYSEEVVYCQRGIVGRPILIDEDRVRLACFDKFTGRRLGFFDVYPFRGDELASLVSRSGFQDVEKILDFGMHEELGPWDFLTLVCKKGG